MPAAHFSGRTPPLEWGHCSCLGFPWHPTLNRHNWIFVFFNCCTNYSSVVMPFSFLILFICHECCRDLSFIWSVFCWNPLHPHSLCLLPSRVHWLMVLLQVLHRLSMQKTHLTSSADGWSHETTSCFLRNLKKVRKLCGVWVWVGACVYLHMYTQHHLSPFCIFCTWK